MRRRRPLKPAEVQALEFLTVVAISGTVGGLIGAWADRRLRAP